MFNLLFWCWRLSEKGKLFYSEALFNRTKDEETEYPESQKLMTRNFILKPHKSDYGENCFSDFHGLMSKFVFIASA